MIPKYEPNRPFLRLSTKPYSPINHKMDRLNTGQNTNAGEIFAVLSIDGAPTIEVDKAKYDKIVKDYVTSTSIETLYESSPDGRRPLRIKLAEYTSRHIQVVETGDTPSSTSKNSPSLLHIFHLNALVSRNTTCAVIHRDEDTILHFPHIISSSDDHYLLSSEIMLQIGEKSHDMKIDMEILGGDGMYEVLREDVTRWVGNDVNVVETNDDTYTLVHSIPNPSISPSYIQSSEVEFVSPDIYEITKDPKLINFAGQTIDSRMLSIQEEYARLKSEVFSSDEYLYFSAPMTSEERSSDKLNYISPENDLLRRSSDDKDYRTFWLLTPFIRRHFYTNRSSVDEIFSVACHIFGDNETLGVSSMAHVLMGDDDKLLFDYTWERVMNKYRDADPLYSIKTMIHYAQDDERFVRWHDHSIRDAVNAVVQNIDSTSGVNAVDISNILYRWLILDYITVNGELHHLNRSKCCLENGAKAKKLLLRCITDILTSNQFKWPVLEKDVVTPAQLDADPGLISDQTIFDKIKDIIFFIKTRDNRLKIYDACVEKFTSTLDKKLDSDRTRMAWKGCVTYSGNSEILMLPAKLEDYITKSTNVQIEAEGSKHEDDVINYMKQMFPDGLHESMLIDFAGLFRGENKEQKIKFLIGVASNGKSCFSNFIKRTFGDYYVAVNTGVFAKPGGEGATSEMMKCRGARIVMVPEAGAEMKIDAGVVKSLTGEEEMSARELYERASTFKVMFRLIAGCNDLPKLKESPAMERRFLAIPCKGRWVKPHMMETATEEQLKYWHPIDPKFDEKSQKWTGAFARILVRYFPKYIEDEVQLKRFDHPLISTETTNRWDNNDSSLRAIKKLYKPEDGSNESIGDIQDDIAKRFEYVETCEVIAKLEKMGYKISADKEMCLNIKRMNKRLQIGIRPPGENVQPNFQHTTDRYPAQPTSTVPTDVFGRPKNITQPE